MTIVGRDLPGVTQELETRSLGKSVFLRRERDIWDQLRWQTGLLADAQGLLSARTKIKELEEERDAFRSRAQEATASVKALAGQLGAEQSEHQLTKVALAEATKAAEASRAEALDWKSKAKDLEKEASQAAEASIAAQAALDVEVREHEVLRGAVRTACEALDVEGAVSDGYVLPEDDEEADVEVTKLLEAAEAPGIALAGLFEEEVVPPATAVDP
ncbi:uncharacterized protein [Miscanthus floridulus]|uniref:uncharacterized protein n=1 Tax=Miscanthus floridulus TaxID=154761 RepID=UPI0034594752